MTLAVAVALLLISCTGTASETSASSQSPPASGTTVSSLEAVDGTTDRFAGFPPLDEADIAATREALEHQIFAAALSAVDMLLPAGRSSCEGAHCPFLRPLDNRTTISRRAWLSPTRYSEMLTRLFAAR